jgi:hypothetical protein
MLFTRSNPPILSTQVFPPGIVNDLSPTCNLTSPQETNQQIHSESLNKINPATLQHPANLPPNLLPLLKEIWKK